ncbi:MAG TPA: hypothetical protein VHX86_09790 [Tepidisphaeraceae bacterium]|jgi:hypothetical protein|nr:hypothetical protein [Tepidisphaeraceae bacterium]
MPLATLITTGKRRRGQLILAAAIVGNGIFGAHFVHAQTTASWNGGSGNWTTASDWSTNPVYPNNGTPTGTTYQAVVAASGSPYTLTDNSTIAVDGLTVESASATVSLSGMLTLSTLNLDQGVFSLQTGGTLSGGSSGGAVTVQNGAQFNLLGGTLENSTFTGSDVVQSGTFSGVTISPGTTITDSSSLILSGSWNNQGMISVASGAALFLRGNYTLQSMGALSGSSGNFEVQGTLTMGSQDTLSIGANSGTWAIGGTVNGGTINVSSGQTVYYGGATLNGVHIAGSDLTVNESNRNVDILGGISIDTGMIDVTGVNASLAFDGPSQTLTNLNINVNAGNLGGVQYLYVGGPNSAAPITLTIASNSLISGNVNIVDSSTFPGDTLTNNGTINANLQNQNLSISTTNFNNNSIAQASNGGILAITSSTWTNGPLGSIIANAATLTMSGSWTNSGAISISNGSTLNLGGSTTLQGFDQINFSGANNTINLTGTLALQSTDTLSIDGSKGTWNLDGGTISSGTVAFSNGQALNIISGVLDGVHVITGGSFTVGGSLTLRNSWSVDTGDIVLSGNSASLTFDGPSQTLNSLSVTGVRGYYNQPSIFVGGPTSGSPITLTLGSSSTIQGGATISNNPATNGGTLVNNGTLDADSYGSSISIATSSFVNNGLAEAQGGAFGISSANWTNSPTGTIVANGQLAGFTASGNWNNLGAITIENGAIFYLGGNVTTSQIGTVNYIGNDNTIYVTGVVNNVGSIFSVSSGDSWYFYYGTSAGGTIEGATIEGGTVAIPAGQTIKSINGTLENVTLKGGAIATNLTNNDLLGIEGGISGMNNPTLIANDGGSIIFEGPSQTISGVTLDGAGQELAIFASIAVANTVTMSPTTVLHGALGVTGNTLDNQGVVHADVNSVFVYLSVASSQFINENLAEATGGATLELYSANTINEPGATILADHATINFAGTTGTLMNYGSIQMNAGTLFMYGGASLDVGEGSLTGSGTIRGGLTLDNDPSHLVVSLTAPGYSPIVVTGSTELGGDLDITFADGFESSISSSEIFDILQSQGGLTGSFLNTFNGGRVETADGFGSFEVEYGTGAYQNEVALLDFEPTVPEPACLGLAPCAFVLMRRRRARR